MGERVAALVETNGEVELDQLAAACRSQLADYKLPERWAIIDALPRNAMGKVVRTGLVDLLNTSEETS
jgi:acyl-CoA synthetase (AMP-forming)/AMP-acid ligase II